MGDILGLHQFNGSPSAVPATITTAAMVDRLSRRVDELAATPRTISLASEPARHHRRSSRSRGGVYYLNALKRHKGIIALISAVGLLTGAGLVLVPHPLYQARTTLEVLDPSQASAQGANLLTQVSILESRSLRKRVAAKLGIALPFYSGSSGTWRNRAIPFSMARIESIPRALRATCTTSRACLRRSNMPPS